MNNATFRCRICGLHDRHPQYHPREMMFGTRIIYPYYACQDCGTVQIVQPPSDPNAFYPPDYYSFQRPVGMEYVIKSRIARYSAGKNTFIGWGFAQLFGSNGAVSIVRDAKIAHDAAILDVGCGNGELLLWLSELGYTRLAGIDPYAPEVHDGPFSVRRRTLQTEAGKYDLIILNHVFEHLDDPHGTLHALRERLRTGGRAIIRIPVADSFAFRHYGLHWVQWDPPRHLFLFTRRSMKRLAADCGLKVTSVTYDSTAFQFWGSELYQRDIPLRDPRSPVHNPRALLHNAPRLWRDNLRAQRLNAAGGGDSATFTLTCTQ